MEEGRREGGKGGEREGEGEGEGEGEEGERERERERERGWGKGIESKGRKRDFSIVFTAALKRSSLKFISSEQSEASEAGQ